jgi:hypothetical protein
MWKDKENYSKLLTLNYLELKKPKKVDLLKLAYCMFFYYSSTYNKNHYQTIIERNFKLNAENFQKKFPLKGRSLISNSQRRKLKEASRNIEGKIINEISETIFNVKE